MPNDGQHRAGSPELTIGGQTAEQFALEVATKATAVAVEALAQQGIRLSTTVHQWMRVAAIAGCTETFSKLTDAGINYTDQGRAGV